MGRHAMLLVEDSRFMAFEIRRGLSRTPIEIEHVTSAADALAWLEAGGDATIVWTDCHLESKPSGPELARAIAERSPEKLVLVVTGDTRHPEIAELPPSVKVFDKTALVAAIKAIQDHIAAR